MTRTPLTVRLFPAQVKQLRAYAFITGRTHQELTEAALEQYQRRAREANQGNVGAIPAVTVDGSRESGRDP